MKFSRIDELTIQYFIIDNNLLLTIMDVHSNGQETGMQFGYRERPYYVELVTPQILNYAH